MVDADGLTFQSNFSNNAVFVIDALGESDLQTARRLHDELSNLVLSDGSRYCHYLSVASREECERALEDILHLSESGMKPIIHIEAHGSQQDGICIADSGQFLDWETLVKWCLRINTAAENNLGVVLASCFGLYGITPVNIRTPCPYYFLVGSDRTVSAGYIEDTMRLFYRKLFDERNLDVAMKEVSEGFKQFHAEKFFCISFAKYIRRTCMGSGANARVERMISEVFASGMPRTPENLKWLRSSAKQFVRGLDRQRIAFEQTARHFLHGKIPLSFDEFVSFVRGR